MTIERFISYGSTLNVFDIDIDPQTQRVFFTDHDNNSLVVYDLKENRSSSIKVGAYPYAVEVNSVTSKAYVTHICNCPIGYAVSVIDLSNGIDSATVMTIDNASFPAARLALNEKTNKVFVTSGTNSLTVIDGYTDKIANVVRVSALDIDINHNSNTIYAIDGNKTLYKIDGATNSIVSNVTINDIPSDAISKGADNRLVALAVNPNTNVVYLVNQIILPPDPNRELFIPHSYLVAVNGTSATIMNASIAQIDIFGNFIAVNENNNKIYTKTVTLDGLKNQILYYNYLSSEENIGAAVIDQLSNKLYLRGQTGIFVVSDVGSSIPEFESGILVVAASSIVMVISLQKYRKS